MTSEGVVVLRTDRDDARWDYGGRRGDEARRFRRGGVLRPVDVVTRRRGVVEGLSQAWKDPDF